MCVVSSITFFELLQEMEIEKLLFSYFMSNLGAEFFQGSLYGSPGTQRSLGAKQRNPMEPMRINQGHANREPTH